MVQTSNGVRLHCALQRLMGDATPEGLWLKSTMGDAASDRFSVKALECTEILGSGDRQVLTHFIGDGSAVQVLDSANLPSCFYRVQIDWTE